MSLRWTRRGVIVAGLVGALLGVPIGQKAAEAYEWRGQHAHYTYCEYEDSPGPCYWDAGSYGNGRGDSFYVTKDQRVVYDVLHVVIQGKHPRLPDAHPAKRVNLGDWALHLGPWEPVKQSLADALAESGARRADTRHWERCWVNVGPTTWIACPGGFTTSS